MKLKGLFVLLLPVLPCAAQEDSIHIFLDEVTLTEHRNLSPISGTMSSSIHIDAKLMHTYPRMFGYTDPIMYLQSLPGVSTNSDHSGGLHVQGGEISHNLIMVSQIPVYGSMNLTGLFSMFNQDHLSTTQFSTSTKSPFLGAELSLDHADTIPSRISGVTTLGPITAQTTLSAPLSERNALTLSLRRSFINTFYGSLLEFDGNPMRYGFTDANLTLMQRIDSRNTIDLNMLYNHDLGETVYGEMKARLDCCWSNFLASLRWRYQGRIKSSVSLFLTHYNMQCNIDDDVDDSGHIPAHITHAGAKTSLTLPYAINIDADANLYNILPQAPYISSNQVGKAIQPEQDALLYNIYLSHIFKVGHYLKITPHLLFSAYNEKQQYNCFNADPTLTLSYDMYRKGTLTFETGKKHQYLTQTGMTNNGLPIEFWIAAGRYFKPQEALFGTLSYDLQFYQSNYALSVQLYGKQLHNQVEYTGLVCDFFTRPYRLEDNLLICSGYNYGINLMLAKQAGKLTGWLSYSYSQSLRQGDGEVFPILFHSSHERRHELNAVLSYQAGPWEIGSNFILGSGNPYTPAKNMYLLSNTMIIYYDDYNSAQLPPYMRLDLSATYNLPHHKHLDHNINLSVFNVTAHKNYCMGYIKVNEEKMAFYYKLAKLVVPIIPSISYTCRF